jgi:hypothetical protein
MRDCVNGTVKAVGWFIDSKGADPVGGIFPISVPRDCYTGRRDRTGWYVYGSAGLPSPRRSIPPELTSLSRSCCKRWGYPGAP